MIKTKAMPIILLATLLIGSVSNVFADSDIIENKPYINGYEDGTFRPNNTITRAEMAKIMTVLEELEEYDNNFIDIEKDHWAAKYIGATEKAGIFRGDDKNKFNPSTELTKAEIASIVSRIVRIEDINESLEISFSDTKGHWAEADILRMARAGVIEGHRDGTFGPDEKVSREDIVKIINRAKNRVIDTEILYKVYNPFSDIGTTWAMEEILAASTNYKYKIVNGIEVIIVDERQVEIYSVEVIAPRLIKINGNALDKISMASVSLSGNRVKEFSTNENGTEATVRVESDITNDIPSKLTVKIGDKTEVFDLNYSEVGSKVEVLSSTYDNNRSNQKLELKLDDKKIEVALLKEMGYKIGFNATKDGKRANIDLFGTKDDYTLDEDGLLSEDIPVGEYRVTVVLIKDGKMLLSDAAKIVISNLDLQ